MLPVSAVKFKFFFRVLHFVVSASVKNVYVITLNIFIEWTINAPGRTLIYLMYIVFVELFHLIVIARAGITTVSIIPFLRAGLSLTGFFFDQNISAAIQLLKHSAVPRQFRISDFTLVNHL